MLHSTSCACSATFNVDVELCISFESRYMAISTLRVMGVHKGFKKIAGNFLEVFFGVSLT